MTEEYYKEFFRLFEADEHYDRSVIANWWSDTGRNIDKCVSEQQLNSALSNFKNELNEQLDRLYKNIIISRRIQLLSTLPNAHFDITNNVLVIPCNNKVLKVIDCDTFDILDYCIDTKQVKFNDVKFDPANARTVKLKSVDLTLTFDEFGILTNAVGYLPELPKPCTYINYYGTEITCNKHNKTRLKQLLCVKHKHAIDRQKARLLRSKYELVCDELSLLPEYDKINFDIVRYMCRKNASSTTGDFTMTTSNLSYWCYYKMFHVVIISYKYNTSSCKKFFEQVIKPELLITSVCQETA